MIAWTPNDEQKSAIANRIDELRHAIEESDYDAMFAVLPGNLLNVISEQAGVPVEALKAQMSEAMAQVMTEVELEAYSMDLDDAQYLTTKSGMQYVLVPTMSRMKAGDMRVEHKTHTLVFEDEGTFYLMRIDELQQIAMLREAYPDFVGVEFPQGSQTVLE